MELKRRHNIWYPGALAVLDAIVAVVGFASDAAVVGVIGVLVSTLAFSAVLHCAGAAVEAATPGSVQQPRTPDASFGQETHNVAGESR